MHASEEAHRAEASDLLELELQEVTVKQTMYALGTKLGSFARRAAYSLTAEPPFQPPSFPVSKTKAINIQEKGLLWLRGSSCLKVWLGPWEHSRLQLSSLPICSRDP